MIADITKLLQIFNMLSTQKIFHKTLHYARLRQKMLANDADESALMFFPANTCSLKKQEQHDK